MTKDRLIEEYQVFFKNNNNSGLSFYGLIPMGVRGVSMIYDRPYTETLQIEFDFDDTCIWEDIEDDETVAKIIDKVQFGNITIAKEGCGTYWILIVNGPKAGEVWLLTEFGVTPVKERLTLIEWRALQIESKNTFWYDAVKNWGPFEYAFFYSHAPKKMATNGSKVFGTNTSLCKDCINFLLKCAEKEKEEYVVTDSEVTRIFMPNGEIEHISKES